MADHRLMRWLNSVGKRVFVEYYDDFKNPNISDEEMIKRLPGEYEYSGSKTRTYCARKIFENKLECEALKLIVDSRADVTAREKASLLLKEIVKES